MKKTLNGLSFCITGVLSCGRDEVAAEIAAHGGEFHKSVKKGTTYLVVGEDVGAAKLAKAEKLGVTMINEGFLRLMMAG